MTVAGPGAGAKATEIPPPDRINVQMMASSEGVAGAERNPFGFGREVVVAPPPPPIVIPPPPPPPPPPVINRPTTPVNTTPVVNIPPAITLTYTGYARDEANEMVAFLETPAAGGAPAGRFNLREDDFLLGRYRVTRITETLVEYEDQERPEASRKQTINIAQQLAPRR
jgi:hypothetical protein